MTAQSLEIVVEVTDDEIVDVHGGDTAVGACVVEDTWALRLNSAFDRDHSFLMRFP